MRIPISTIKINPGRRETDPTHIDELSQSIADVGLLNPITVDSSHTLSGKAAGLDRNRMYRMQYRQYPGGTGGDRRKCDPQESDQRRIKQSARSPEKAL